MQNIKQHLSLLGFKVTDKVLGMTGVVTSISFDLYGCVQGWIDPGIDKDGKKKDGYWLDVRRLKKTSKEAVMEPPNFDYGPVAEGKHGPAEKGAPAN